QTGVGVLLSGIILNTDIKSIMKHGVNNSINSEELEKIPPRKAQPPLTKGADFALLNKPLFEKEGLGRFIPDSSARRRASRYLKSMDSRFRGNDKIELIRASLYVAVFINACGKRFLASSLAFARKLARNDKFIRASLESSPLQEAS
ncbi:MAG TPA: hypothetical protein VI728_11595, partial [Syntrophales bacterium]|nr:hypothetical protein [Syntrophales bacterium]